VSGLGYWLFKNFFSVTPWFTLPNILGSAANEGEVTVFEKLLRRDEELEEIAPVAIGLLEDELKRGEVIDRLQKLKAACMMPGANAKAAAVLNDFLSSL